MRVTVRIVGQTPMMLHNERLANPEDPFTREIAAITAKGQRMTDSDRAELKRLRWFGGMYIGRDGGEPVVPTANIRRCFREAAKAIKLGEQVVRGVVPIQLEVPIEYDGPRDLNELFKQPEFIDTRMVGIQRRRVPTTRPIFPRWALSCEFEVAESVMNYDQFEEIVQRAGSLEGLCDGRKIGFGRFSATVSKS
jgi:hypothetical protein